MDEDDIFQCEICHTGYESMEDLNFHSCLKIKQEIQDPNIFNYHENGLDDALDISEDFLAKILLLVDELCEVVNNGDKGSLISKKDIVF